MSLGVGFAAVRSDKNAEEDSFGLVALCSIGPILAVLLLGLLYHPKETGYIPAALPDVQDSVALWRFFVDSFPEYNHNLPAFPVYFNSDWNGDWFLYCQSRAGCLRINGTG